MRISHHSVLIVKTIKVMWMLQTLYVQAHKSTEIHGVDVVLTLIVVKVLLEMWIHNQEVGVNCVGLKNIGWKQNHW